MEQDKPFKTIEVVDNDTQQICKIACMSCIRGHRTTSCGIPVCRTKIFWTVKRPGRPSNSCTCRFNSSGVCKCVTAIPKCPHKSKKGEKRSAECRCDEQGRFCCLLEPNHWESLFALSKPTVQFFASRDALETWQMSQRTASAMNTPAATSGTTSFFSVASPNTTSSCCGGRADTASTTASAATPATTLATPRLSRSIAPSPRESVSSPTHQAQPTMPPFGILNGVTTPATLDNHIAPDVISWNQHSSQLPVSTPTEEVGSCCGPRADDYNSISGTLSMQSPGHYLPSSTPYEQAYTSFSAATSASGQYAFDFDRWNQNYHIYQFPNAICQNCGLNGCTCRSCPPLMQNFGTTSWAQSCGRRHARIAPAPPPIEPSISALHQHQQQVQPVLDNSQYADHRPQQNGFYTMPVTMNGGHDHLQFSPTSHDLALHPKDHPITNAFDPHDDLLSPALTEPLGFNDYMGDRLDPPSHAMDENMFGG